MEAHVERMQKEFDELMDRIDKLEEFIANNPTFKSLTPREQQLLVAQRGAMQGYAAILLIRIQG